MLDVMLCAGERESDHLPRTEKKMVVGRVDGNIRAPQIRGRGAHSTDPPLVALAGSP